MMGVLVACAELKDTPEAVATRMRLLILHEGTHVVHLLHGARGKAVLNCLSPMDNIILIELLRKLQWLERRCRKADEAHGAPWIDTVDGQFLPSLEIRWPAECTDEERQAVREEVLRLCTRYIPSFVK